MTEELKPCPVPWCSNEGAEIVWQPFARAQRVICQSCNCRGPLGKTEADAIAAWNTRSHSPELTQLVKAARENAETLRRIQDSLSRYLEPDGDIKNAISAVNAVLEIADHKDTLAKQRALIAALASFKEVE